MKSVSKSTSTVGMVTIVVEVVVSVSVNVAEVVVINSVVVGKRVKGIVVMTKTGDVSITVVVGMVTVDLTDVENRTVLVVVTRLVLVDVFVVGIRIMSVSVVKKSVERMTDMTVMSVSTTSVSVHVTKSCFLDLRGFIELLPLMIAPSNAKMQT